MEPESLSEPVHGVHPHAWGGGRGGSPRLLLPRASRERSRVHNRHLRFQENLRTRGAGKGRQRGDGRRRRPGRERRRRARSWQMNGRCRGAVVHGRRPSGARARGRRPEYTHTFQGLQPPERKQARGARAATTARAGRSRPRRLVTETSPKRGGPRGRRWLAPSGLPPTDRHAAPVRPRSGQELGSRPAGAARPAR